MCTLGDAADVNPVIKFLQQSASPSVDMLPFGVTIPATVSQGSEIPEGLMNNPVHEFNYLGRSVSHVNNDIMCKISYIDVNIYIYNICKYICTYTNGIGYI
jgi:hypothetical protein